MSRIVPTAPPGRRLSGWFALFLIAALALSVAPFGTAPAVRAFTQDPASVFINEFHYDNAGTDTGEFIEIAGPAGTDLTGWSIVLYNGNGGAPYSTENLSGSIADQGNGFGTFVVNYPVNGIQNGSPDGIALVNATGDVVQFLSYEGSFTAVGGPADGSASTDIGVSENGSTPVGFSLQLSGTGTAYQDFSWAVPADDTPGAFNNGQTFGSTPAQPPVINEFVFNHTGSDTNEYVEIFAAPNTDYSSLSLIQIEGDDSAPGTIDSVTPVGITDADGFWNTGFLNNTFENGSVTLLLVEEFSGSVGDDLDTNNDGTPESTPWTAIVDAVAINDGGGSDRTYGMPVLSGGFDGGGFTPGGASRIPNGVDTDSANDWVRNDFDLAGLPGFVGTPEVGEALNTPGAVNQLVEPPPVAACSAVDTPIGLVQGPADATPLNGQTVTVQGVISGDYEGDTPGFRGFFMQNTPDNDDDDPLTSDGIFVFVSDNSTDRQVGQVVQVTGTAGEFRDQTQISVSDPATQIVVCDETGSISPVDVTLPLTSLADLERYEGMLVRFPQPLVISEYFNFDRFGEIVLALPLPGLDRPFTPTSYVEPGLPAQEVAEQIALRRITLDDGRSDQNPPTLRHPNGNPFTLTNFFRGGDTVANTTGVLDFRFGLYRIQPTAPADYTSLNERPTAPEPVGGSLQVAAFNVLNYFVTLDNGTDDICGGGQNLECRGADNIEEFERQRAKLLAALEGLDADIIGLIELENTPGVEPLADIVAGLPGYDYIATGAIGSDAIKVGLIYRTATVQPVGAAAVLDDPAFVNPFGAAIDRNRPAVAQTFEETATGARFTVVVNHFKSKSGSELDDRGGICVDGDPGNDIADCDQGDGQGYFNATRTAAAQALADWLATDPTGSGDPDFMIIGDLNAYDEEDPIKVLQAAGYVDLIELFNGEFSYSFVFDGQFGYLDYALANSSLLPQVTGATEWHINADESDVFDYDTSFKPAEQEALYEPNEIRTSDHDPVVVGLNLAAPPADLPPGIAIIGDAGQCLNGMSGELLLALSDEDIAGLQVAVSSTDNRISATISGSGELRTLAVTARRDNNRYTGMVTVTVSAAAGNQAELTLNVMVGTQNNDVLTGVSDMSNIIFGDNGQDELTGGALSDLICGGDGDNHIWGGAGADSLFGGSTQDRIWGGEGNDYLNGGNGDNWLYGENGDDYIAGGNTRDTIEGGAGDDLVDAGSGDDLVDGGEGNDTLNGQNNNDTLRGGPGADFLNGGDGFDQAPDFNADEGDTRAGIER